MATMVQAMRLAAESYFADGSIQHAVPPLHALLHIMRDGVWNVGWVTRDGDTEQIVTRNARLGAYVRYPAWSPTGDAIYYELAETTGNIWLLERSAPADGGRDGGRP